MATDLQNLDDYLSYFEQIARNNKAILHTDSEKHFEEIDLEQLLLDFKTSVTDRCLIIECYRGDFTDNYSDNIQDTKTGAFTVIKQVPPRGTTTADEFQLKKEALIFCEKTVKSILSKMRKDSLRTNDNLPPFIRNFDINTIIYTKLPPLAGDWHGWRCEFSFSEQNNLIYDTNDWL